MTKLRQAIREAIIFATQHDSQDNFSILSETKLENGRYEYEVMINWALGDNEIIKVEI